MGRKNIYEVENRRTYIDMVEVGGKG